MSSFSQFKKSQQLNKSNRSNSKDSFRSFEMQGGNLANLSFNTDEIIFRLTGGDETVTNRQLKVANNTGVRLYYQVSTNYPDYFDIRPKQDILDANSVTNIAFRLNARKVLEDSDRKGSPLQLINSFLRKNKIMFEWGSITEENIKYNQIPPIISKQGLKARAEQFQSRIKVEEILKEAMKSPEIRAERQTPEKQFSATKPYNKETDMRENRMMGQPKGFQINSKTSLQEEAGEYSGLLTIPIIAAVALCSFLVGYMSA